MEFSHPNYLQQKEKDMEIRNTTLVLVLLAFTAQASVAQSEFVFETAVLGPTGQVAGFGITPTQFLGAVRS